MPRTTKRAKIEAHLKQFNSITTWVAITQYKVTRLSAIIYNLKADGWEFRDEDFPNGDGDGGTFRKYHVIAFPPV
jgi:hypothetical protein